MSCEVVSVPQISVALGSGVGAALAPAMVGLGLAYGTFLVVQKLRSDYSAALSELHLREAEANFALDQVAHKQAVMTATMQAKGDLVSSTTTGVATEFISNAIAEVHRMAEREELASFRVQAEELAKKLEASVDNTELAKEVVKLTAAIHAALNKLAASGKIKPNVVQLLATTKTDIEKVATEEQRAPLIAQLQKLEALPAEEFGVALQGVANLRDRVGKLMQTQIAEEQEKLRRRQITSEAVAMLQALSKVPEAAEAKQAVSLLEQISNAYAKDKAPSISSLEGFLNKSKALFESCEARLNASITSAYVSDSVADVLMEMGYKVSSVPAEENGCMITFDQDTGMVVSVDKAGQLKTEMVAFNEDAREPDMESQEKVCALVDQVFEGLRKRDIKVKEKFRKTMKHGKLKLVDKPEDAAPQAESKPKERALS